MRRRRAPWRILALTGVAGLAGLVLWITPHPPAGPPRDRALTPRTAGPGAIGIVTLGTSLTLRATWPEALAAALRRCAGRPVTLDRHARAGATSGWGRDEAAAVAGTAPDLVTIEFAINDADLLDGIGRSDATANIEAIVERLRGANPAVRIVLLTTNPVTGLGRLTRPRLVRFQADYHELAERLNLGLVDGRARWQGADRAAIRDGVHPDPAAEAERMTPPLLAVAARALRLDCPASLPADAG